MDRKIVDLNTIPFHMRMDYERRNENIRENKKLCEHCSATGNELFSMYRKCPKCSGSGIERKLEETK